MLRWYILSMPVFWGVEGLSKWMLSVDSTGSVGDFDCGGAACDIVKDLPKLPSERSETVLEATPD